MLHLIHDVRLCFTLQSPADRTQRIHAGDEMIQVNRQTVVSPFIYHMIVRRIMGNFSALKEWKEARWWAFVLDWVNLIHGREREICQRWKAFWISILLWTPLSLFWISAVFYSPHIYRESIGLVPTHLCLYNIKLFRLHLLSYSRINFPPFMIVYVQDSFLWKSILVKKKCT